MTDPGHPAPITRVERQQMYANQWLTLYEDATDVSGKPGTYTVVSRPDSVSVVVSSPGSSVLMLDSFRYPTGRFGLELPMGAVDPGESPESAARRELREETGLDGADLAPVGWFFALPGLTDQKVYVFAATVPERQIRAAHTVGSEAELTGTVLVTADELPALIAAGRVTDSVTLSSLSLYSAHRRVSAGLADPRR